MSGVSITLTPAISRVDDACSVTDAAAVIVSAGVMVASCMPLRDPTDREKKRPCTQREEHRVGQPARPIDQLETDLFTRCELELHGFPHERVTDSKRMFARRNIAAEDF